MTVARKPSKTARRLTDARMRAIIDNMVDAPVAIDEHGVIDSFNAAAERIFGYSADAAIGRNVAVLAEERDRSQHGGYIRNDLKTGKGKVPGVGPREVKGRRKDGSTVPLELAVSEMFLGGKRTFIGAMRDITDRKHAEHALRGSKAQLAGILDTAMEAIIAVDDSQRIRWFSHGAARTFGYSS